MPENYQAAYERLRSFVFELATCPECNGPFSCDDECGYYFADRAGYECMAAARAAMAEAKGMEP